MQVRSWSASRDGETLTDRDLVVAFKGGDAHAYALIYREYRPLAESICQRVLGNHDDAAEAAQETMLKVFQGLPRFNGRYLLRAWVARIATNVCLDMLRKRNRRVDEVDSPDAEALEGVEDSFRRAEAEDPSEIAARADEAHRIRDLLQDLPSHHRDALVMREFHGRSHEDIGAALGMTAPQVKALIHRAKKGFRRAWEVQAGRASVFAWPAILAVPVRWLRRVLSPAKEAAEAAAAPVIQLSAQPAVAQATVMAGDRVAAAAGALLVAGTIGIGAAALPSRAVPNAPSVSSANVVVAQPDAGTTDVLKPAPQRRAAAAPATASSAGVAAPRPRPLPDGSPVEEAGESPAPEPSAEPSGQPVEPQPQPAPAWTMELRTGVPSNETCGCPITPRLSSDSGTVGTPGGHIRFAQSAQGAALDAEGDPAWGLGLSYGGRAWGETGDLTVDFTLNVGGDTFTYTARLTLSRLTKYADDWAYVFDGTYEFSAGPAGDSEPIARRGRIATTLRFWRDATLYRAEIALS